MTKRSTAAAPLMQGRPTREEIAFKVQNILAQTLRTVDDNDISGTGKASFQIADAVLALIPAQGQDILSSHGKLLADINKAAHAAGTNAWVRDVLHRAHRAIRKSFPAAPILADQHAQTGD